MAFTEPTSSGASHEVREPLLYTPSPILYRQWEVGGRKEGGSDLSAVAFVPRRRLRAPHDLCTRKGTMAAATATITALTTARRARVHCRETVEREARTACLRYSGKSLFAGEIDG